MSQPLDVRSKLPPTASDVQDCLACRVIGSGALGATGLYALNMSRAHQPGSVFGKRAMAVVGAGFLVASWARWTVELGERVTSEE